MSKAERLHGTAAHLQAELRMTRVGLLRVQMLLDQYDAVCTSIQDTIVQCEHSMAQTSGVSTPSATLADQFFLQQACIKTQVRRLLNQAGLQIEQCSTALNALQAEVQGQGRPKPAAHRRAPRPKDYADSAWTEEMP
ncbi:MAG: hypothetical protein JWO59_1023 [Chloroflexi bacterium]|nr:hypothetical protein [Chloroflexota bacterium]